MRTMYFSDHLEKQIADAFDEAGINYVHESECRSQGLDFYLPDYDLYIEIKQFHSVRISKQMQSQKNVIAIQGTNSVKAVVSMLSKINTNYTCPIPLT